MNNNQLTQARFAKLARMKMSIFHASDLANIWQIKDKNTLYTTLKRYTQKGLLFRIYKGLYSLEPVDKINPYLLGLKALHKYAYISTETILVQNSIIQQNISAITLISDKSLKFSVGKYKYYCRQLKDAYLFNNIGIKKEDELNTASIERAVADLLYFNPRAYFDGRNLINWQKVKQIQKNIGYINI